MKRKAESYYSQVSSHIDSLEPLISDIAVSLYNNPEIGLKEFYAMGKITSLLETDGWDIERAVAGLDTAFIARTGRSRPAFAFMAEYDALAGIGHGCGHNLIAAASLAAGIALKRALPSESHEVSWLVIGTPAEESYGGKVAMADRGVFDHIDAAFLAHPGVRNGVGGTSWASHPVELTFIGKPSHAGGNPQEGINALDACVHAYTMIRNLRNQLRDDVRLAGIITHGGEAQNVIPEFAQMRFTVRSRSWQFVENTLIPRIVRCAQSAADANLTELKWCHHELLFKECLSYPVLQDLAHKHFAGLGEKVLEPPDLSGGGTSDVGAVSWVCPTIQIGYKITEARGHSREMADSTVTEYALEQTIKAAKILAFMALDLLARPELLKAAHEHLRAQNG